MEQSVTGQIHCRLSNPKRCLIVAQWNKKPESLINLTPYKLTKRKDKTKHKEPNLIEINHDAIINHERLESIL
jgi:hypothetical protein